MKLQCLTFSLPILCWTDRGGEATVFDIFPSHFVLDRGGEATVFDIFPSHSVLDRQGW